MTKKHSDTQRYRKIGHNLKPVVIIGAKGVTPGVIEETSRALSDHELIKIKLPAVRKAMKTHLIEQLCSQCEAEMVHCIGNMVLLLKENPKPNPKLSNLIRPQ